MVRKLLADEGPCNANCRSQLATIVLAAREEIVGVIVGGILGHALCTGEMECVHRMYGAWPYTYSESWRRFLKNFCKLRFVACLYIKNLHP